MTYGEPIPSAGPALTPIQVVRHLRWLGELSTDDMVTAIRAAAEMDVAAKYPELGAADINALRQQARAMTRSRLQAWKEGRERQPTWLEVRALMMGLDRIFD